jgi:hypothetical protein
MRKPVMVNMSIRVPLKVKRWYEKKARALDVTPSRLAALPVIAEHEKEASNA